MNILFYFGHPAQFLFAKHTIKNLRENHHTVYLLIRSKDVLEDLVRSEGWDYENILPEGRKNNYAGLAGGVLKRDYRLFRYVKKRNVDIMIGSDPSLAHVGRLLNIPVITTVEDDFDVIPRLAKITYPFTTHIFAPEVCRTGKKYESKKLAYNGYMKLAYLHPRYFTPDPKHKPGSGKPYLLVRLANLTAHHDDGISGLQMGIIDNLTEAAGDEWDIFISSEYELPAAYEALRLHIEPKHIHHVLYYSGLFISDSQSMSVEASMLGTPSIRYSGFAGRISVLEELEHVYGLTHSVKPPGEEKLLELAVKLMQTKGLKESYQAKRQAMLADKIDVTELLTDLIARYPDSLERF